MFPTAEMVLPSLLLSRQSSHFPCPGGNSSQIGELQKFNVLCGTDIGGVEIDRMQVDSLNTCVSICTSHQAPRCDGVTFRQDNTCIFKSLTAGATLKPTPGGDSATGILASPPPTSNCGSLGQGSIELVQAKNFNLQCGQIFAGNDIEQQFQPDFSACLAACANNTACGGVSYDSQQSQGFKNCYVKTSVTTGGLLAKAGVDSAFVAVDNNSAAPANPAPAPATTATSLSVPATTAAPVLPNSAAPIPSPPAVATSIAAAMLSFAAPLEEATATTSSALPTLATTTGAQPDQAPAATSSAWIAAPVIGGLAALTLSLSIFILWGRRRGRGIAPFGFLGKLPRRGGRGEEDEDAGGLRRGRPYYGAEKLADDEEKQQQQQPVVRAASSMSSRRLSTVSVSGGPSGPAPGSRGGAAGFRVLSGSGRRVGHESRTAGTGPGLEGLMVVGAKAGLRDSQNGLRLNGVSSGFTESVPGIPEGFAGPPDETPHAR